MSKKDSIDANLHRKKDILHKYKEIECRNTLQYYVAQDVKRKENSKKHGYDSPIDKEKGKQWFYDGMKLDDASDDMRTNVSFVAGYNMAYRRQLVNNQLFELGREYFDKGYSIKDLPDKYRDNEYFMNGYNDGMNNHKHR